MIKSAAHGIVPRICWNNCLKIGRTNNAQLAERVLLTSMQQQQKYISQTQQCRKKFNIIDHFDFDKKVINSEIPVIVNFHAEWCDPCKILTPKMIELLENSDDINLAIIDVDNNAELVEAFQVKAVPAILAFRNGVVVDKFIGLSDANNIDKLITTLKSKQTNDKK